MCFFPKNTRQGEELLELPPCPRKQPGGDDVWEVHPSTAHVTCPMCPTSLNACPSHQGSGKLWG